MAFTGLDVFGRAVRERVEELPTPAGGCIPTEAVRRAG